MSIEPSVRVLVVTACPHWHSVMRLPGLFHRAGVAVDLLAPERLDHESPFVRLLPDRPADLAGIIRRLREHLAVHEKDYQHVFPADDMLIGGLSQQENRDWMASWFPVSPSNPWFEALCRKDRFNLLCQQHGIRVPENRTCRSLGDAEQVAQEFGFPVMLKKHADTGGTGVRLVPDAGSLGMHYASLMKHGYQEFSVQRYISGRCGGFYVMARHGTVVQGYAFYKTKIWPKITGPTATMQYTYSPQLEALAQRVAGLTGFHGIFGLDWMESDEDGQIYVLEMNPRPEAAAALAPRFGLSSAEGLSLLWGQGQPPASPCHAGRSRTIRLFPQDFCRSIEERDWAGIRANLVDTLLLRNNAPWNEPGLLLIYCHQIYRLAFGWLRQYLSIGPRIRALFKLLARH